MLLKLYSPITHCDHEPNTFCIDGLNTWIQLNEDWTRVLRDEMNFIYIDTKEIRMVEMRFATSTNDDKLITGVYEIIYIDNDARRSKRYIILTGEDVELLDSCCEVYICDSSS